jgi:undecaprenyl-diphosphatase
VTQLAQLFYALVLGIVQGLTEFIPVSSSAHLVLVPWFFGWPPLGLLFDTMLHWGTLLSLVVIFWRDYIQLLRAWGLSIGRRSLAEPEARLAWFILVGTIPAVVVGLLFKDFVEALFGTPLAVGFFLLVTAGLLAGSEWLARRLRTPRTLEQMNWADAILIGVAQALALAPGISRSGATIATGLARGIRRDLAARFSFLLGTPAFFGAGLLMLVDAIQEDAGGVAGQFWVLALGFVAAAATGVVAIRFLLKYLRTHTLYVFAVYCLVVGLLTIVVWFVRAG